ncbi:hypothetical protein ACF8LF_18000 [Pseudomonas putida]|uniref:DUF4760 domain-containing protein n=1 Tax=Pseudomonas citronellolis TaxID=53408 RepID=A0AAW6P3W5_9PSED|nr:hypothetical protein [Pseudomonas citronellolis]MDF3841400.1 hypothetical protein [Pseudomonas citronellolis]
MIPENWRTYKIEIRPLVILVWLLISAPIVLLMFWVWSADRGWLDAFEWSQATAPGWVQAFGSVGAIVAAIWISNAQGRRERMTRLRQEYHYMFKAFNTAAFASGSMKAIAGALAAEPTDTSTLNIYLGQLRQSCVELDQFSYADFVDLSFADAWALHRRGVQLLASEMEKHLSGTGTNLIAGAAMLAAESTDRVEKMREALEMFSVRAGNRVWTDHHP